MKIIRCPKGSGRHEADLDDITIPDMWHVAERAKKKDPRAAEAIQETWQLAHDLLWNLRDLAREEQENGELTHEEHREKHQRLHSALDELVSDLLLHNPGARPSQITVQQLMDWSHTQTQDPLELPTNEN